MESRSRLRTVLLVIACAIVLVQWVRITVRTGGDIRNHLAMGARFIEGEHLYVGGLNVVYPPFWAMAYSAVGWMPAMVGRGVLFALGPAAMAGLAWMLREVAEIEERRAWAAAAIVSVATCRFWFRDLDDGGPNLVLLTMVWGGIYLWTRGRDWLAGVPLGLAIALKCTPVIFLGYFLFKRQWKVALASAAVAAGATVAPALVMGWDSYAQHMGLWWDLVVRSMAATDPAVEVLWPADVQNKSLRAAMGKLIDSPGEIRFLMGVAAVGVAWLFRRGIRDRHDELVIWELATISVLMALYSPITWTQHCVAVIPAVYLLVRGWLYGLDNRAELLGIGVVFIMFVAGGRLLEPLHITTLGMVGLVAILLAEHHRLRRQA